MDAVHNIPVLLTCWEQCDVEMLRAYLRACDDKWRDDRHAMYGLVDVYDRALASASAKAAGT